MVRADMGLRDENENVMQLRFNENAPDTCINNVLARPLQPTPASQNHVNDGGHNGTP